MEKTKTIPITLSKKLVADLDRIARRESSSRNRLLRIAIIKYLEENGN